MNRPITLVHYWGGSPKTVNSNYQATLAVFQRCQQQGWRNYLVCYRMPEDPALLEPFRKAGCGVFIQPQSHRNFDPVSIWRTYKLLRHLKCDIFHCDNDHTSPMIGAALAGVPVRIWSKLAMSSYYEKGIAPKGLHRLMPSTRVTCLCAHRIMAISEKVRLELMESGCSGKHIDTIYQPVDYMRYSTAAKVKFGDKLGLNPSHILIATVGHAVPVKGWDIAIRAFAKVHNVIPNARLVFVGSITSSEETRIFQQLADLIRHYKLSKYIHFLGHRNDIPEILKSSDIFILPSRSEGMPGALIEAMAAGLPCVAARAGGIPEVISHGDNGLLFEKENEDELSGHLVRLIGDQLLRTKLASQASSRARAFGISAYVDKVVKCYKTLLGNNSARSLSE
ncbi:MAG TPA: glycosyltransferase family 4 protein [Sedimentisphaerales bacterium]|nr:glycosyltransferase family 4 protein [Sedimentisphaerales bacterium]